MHLSVSAFLYKFAQKCVSKRQALFQGASYFPLNYRRYVLNNHWNFMHEILTQRLIVKGLAMRLTQGVLAQEFANTIVAAPENLLPCSSIYLS